MTIIEISSLLALLITVIGWWATFITQRKILQKQKDLDKELLIFEKLFPRKLSQLESVQKWAKALFDDAAIFPEFVIAQKGILDQIEDDDIREELDTKGYIHKLVFGIKVLDGISEGGKILSMLKEMDLDNKDKLLELTRDYFGYTTHGLAPDGDFDQVEFRRLYEDLYHELEVAIQSLR